ncbi:AraC family transcriptional regulator [Noviherbaspirillum galbum]|uniref:AraC family transcriptional regulator n=1 Tax=Noviherbaspirillum galbum TaxID=2709383 RepID=A0A6B3SSD8_9BURK|nr:AraC family transcriptional regulator [Noviherbaspirillum galbum]NEX63683.1 AraC family transcriptional regulator [Noviherbaspirillum galbum]
MPGLLRDAGICLDETRNPDARFSPESISRLWELAVERSKNPYLGLAMPDIAHPASFDVIVHVMMTCPDLMAALERFLRYMRIVSDAADIRLVKNDIGHGLTIALVDTGHSPPRARIEFVVLTILNILRWITGLNLRPLSVDFPYPEPSDLQPYHLAFRCPLRFDASVHQIHFSEDALKAELPMANPALAALNDRMAGEHLHRLDAAKLTSRVKELVVRRLPDGDPLRADIAREMCLSERTLQRRLQEEGTSFNELVDTTRRDLADQYLRIHRITLAQTAYLLGFADQSTFFRACKRWFGTSPGDYRSRPD